MAPPAGVAIGAAGSGPAGGGGAVPAGDVAVRSSRSDLMSSTIAAASGDASSPWYVGITGGKPRCTLASGSIIDSVR